MSEERFRLIKIDDYVFQIHDIDNDLYLVAEQICSLLNEQQTTINRLKERLEKINGGYGLLTYRSGLTANEWLIESQERELKKKNEQISALKEENERLRKELDCFHPVMFQDMRKGTVVLYLKELQKCCPEK